MRHNIKETNNKQNQKTSIYATDKSDNAETSLRESKFSQFSRVFNQVMSTK